jgi:hypothetical protein
MLLLYIFVILSYAGGEVITLRHINKGASYRRGQNTLRRRRRRRRIQRSLSNRRLYNL